MDERRHIHTKVSLDQSVLHDRVLFGFYHIIHCRGFIIVKYNAILLFVLIQILPRVKF